MASGAERVNPYQGDTRHKGEQVREMFDNIAPAYDFMNRAMTFGIDKLWRRRAVGMIRRHLSAMEARTPEILDVATGTADLAILLAKSIKDSRITGIDLSTGMIEVGRKKAEKAGLSHRIALGVADCLALPFANDTFHCVTGAYGVRNFEKLSQGYREMLRVLKPGGMLCVIELSTPTSAWAKPLYGFYTKHIIPAAGRMVSRDTRAYAYLPESIAAVAQGQQMTALIEEAGFGQAKFLSLTFGVCTIYTALKG